MTCYECIYIIHPDLDEEAETAAKGQVNDIIDNGGGRIYRRENWGKKRLAYEIRKQSRGVYQLIRFVGTPEILKGLERLFRLDEAYLKRLTVIVKDDPETTEQAAPEADNGEAGKPEESKPVATKPEATKSEDTKSVDTKPEGAKSEDTKPEPAAASTGE